MSTLEVVTGACVVLFTGGVGWWAHYITSGAAKAHRLTETVIELERTIAEHEKREEKKFEEVSVEITGFREAFGELIGSVGKLHGKVDSLSLFLRNGGKPKG